MSELQTPHVTERAKRAATARRERLAAELRANLARRRAQGRARAEDAAPHGKDGGDDGSAA